VPARSDDCRPQEEPALDPICEPEPDRISVPRQTASEASRLLVRHADAPDLNHPPRLYEHVFVLNLDW
jgi:hypothetical protein